MEQDKTEIIEAYKSACKKRRKKYRESKEGKEARKKYRESEEGKIWLARQASYQKKRKESGEDKIYRKEYRKSEKGKEAFLLGQRRYEKKRKNKIKIKASRIVRDEIRRGRLQRGACVVCGINNAEAHHENYTSPLDIMWLCGNHHKERHLHLRQKEKDGVQRIR